MGVVGQKHEVPLEFLNTPCCCTLALNLVPHCLPHVRRWPGQIVVAVVVSADQTNVVIVAVVVVHAHVDVFQDPT